ncbi:uncharacterized protein LOC141903823 [Tubulanus polymorphus]|uniref:uncharacterized protein LOC141903823 n=1 Tax=Tubulanus polymorphus TaxID=672921 RepID=UPI003DA2DD7A
MAESISETYSDSDESERSDSVSSDSSRISEIEEGNNSNDEIVVINPFDFEPDASDDEVYSASVWEDAWRTEVDRLKDWCTCGHFQPLGFARECVCCQEIPEVVSKLDEATVIQKMEFTCMTDHPGLNSDCLDPWNLQCAWSQYKQQYKGSGFEGPAHAKYRHIAYRQFVRRCWNYLGKDCRVVLPSCVVSCIRAHFPPPGLEEDFKFKGHQWPKLKK